MAKRRVIVKDILNLIPDDKEVLIQFFAYGIHYAFSEDSGKTCRQLKENMNFDCLHAVVTVITSKNDAVLLSAELIHL